MGLFDIFKKKKTTSSSNKPSVEEFTLQTEREWEQALKNREPLDTMATFYVGKATYNAILMIAKANKFDFEDEYFQHMNYDDSIDETKEPYKSLLKRFRPVSSGIIFELGNGDYYVLNWKEKKIYYFDHEDDLFKEAQPSKGLTFDQFMDKCKDNFECHVKEWCR